MSSNGHPVISLSAILSGWVGARAFMLMPVLMAQSPTLALVGPSASSPAFAARPERPTPTPGPSHRISIILPDAIPAYTPIKAAVLDPPVAGTGIAPRTHLRIALAPPEPVLADPIAAQLPGSLPLASGPVETPKGRPMVSAWLALRSTADRTSLATSGQLGGSQMGARLTVPVKSIAPHTLLGLSARASMPLQQARGKEAAMGVLMRREGPVPVELGIERRIAIDTGGRNAFAIVAVTGIYDRPITQLTTLSGYAQAGMVGLRRRDGFVDGAVSIDRKILSRTAFSISAGGGAWGAAQPGLSRLDVGPVATIRVTGPSNALRISAAWRFRVAGNAEPGSGPALTIGTDF